ncbi:MAG TPA: hypothetical protein DCZ91_13245 [Lachnospiraceae bacterium]|nr:hypothetical protein [Lachnospiraceae bacterium]
MYDMKKTKLAVLVLMLISLFLLSDCGKAKSPVTLHTFRLFHTDMSSGDIALYIEWENSSRNKMVDSLILSMSHKSDSAHPLLVQLQEPGGVEPQSSNSRKWIVLEHSELPDKETASYDVSIRQVNFTDGSIWESDGAQAVLSVEVDGQKGDGAFPVRLNQAHFYESSPQPREELDPIYFQIDWTNLSQTDSIIGVVYQIVAKTAEGNIIPNGEGCDVTYISRFYADPEQWISPSADNAIFTESVPAFSAACAFRKGGAAIFEVTVCRVIDSNGIVWEAPDNDRPIGSVLTGKKGYSFLDNAPNASVQTLIKRIQTEATICGLGDLGQPAVSIKDQNYCLLRYEDIDVRVELSEKNEVLAGKTSLVLYAVLQYDDGAAFIQAFNTRLSLLIRCVCTAVLTDRPYSELIQKLDEFQFKEGGETFFEKLEVDGYTYDVYGNVLTILDEHSNIILCDIFGIFGMEEELYYPPNIFFWIRESPWPSQNVDLPR